MSTFGRWGAPCPRVRSTDRRRRQVPYTSKTEKNALFRVVRSCEGGNHLKSCGHVSYSKGGEPLETKEVPDKCSYCIRALRYTILRQTQLEHDIASFTMTCSTRQFYGRAKLIATRAKKATKDAPDAPLLSLVDGHSNSQKDMVPDQAPPNITPAFPEGE